MPTGIYERTQLHKDINRKGHLGMTPKSAFKKGSIPWNKNKKNPYSQNTLSKMSNAKKGKIPWNKGKKGLQEAWNKNIPCKKETKEKLRIINTGKILSEDVKKKISLSLKGHKAWNKNVPMSIEAKIKQRLSHLGSKNYNWKGGVDLFNSRVRKSLYYKLWHKICLERDWFTCQKCRQMGKELHVHHINNFSDFPEIRFAIDNGITLCDKCHREFHKLYGIKNNTQGQIDEFLIN